MAGILINTERNREAHQVLMSGVLPVERRAIIEEVSSKILNILSLIDAEGSLSDENLESIVNLLEENFEKLKTERRESLRADYILQLHEIFDILRKKKISCIPINYYSRAASVFYSVKDYSSALYFYDQYLSFEPNDKEALLGKVRTLEILKSVLEAFEVHNKLIGLYPKNAELRFQYAQYLQSVYIEFPNNGDLLSHIMSFYSQAIAMDSSKEIYRYECAVFLAAIGKEGKASEYYDLSLFSLVQQ